MFSKKRYTIKPNKLGYAPVKVGPKSTSPSNTSYNNLIMILKIIFVLILMAGVGVGTYYLVNKIQENFKCQPCQAQINKQHVE